MNEKPSGERKKSGESAARLEPMGRYELVRQLGRGGMAEVFLARQTGMAGFSKQLVIKRVLPELVDDAKFVEMFLDEARLAARLTHPNICQVFELGEVNGQYFIAMEHVPGVTLTHLIITSRDKKLPMPLAAAFRIVAQLCEALSYAHQLSGDDGRPLNLVHRDVTPSNVMVTPDGSVKLLDFGIARAADRTHQTQVGVAKGKLGFMSPEQLRSPQDIDHKSDLFAVGAVLYTLVVGRTPYADVIKTSNGLRDMAHGRFPAPRVAAPQVPEVVEQLIMKAMAADPHQRFLSALDFSRELEKVAMSLSLSLGPHALLDFMSEMDRDVSERTTRKIQRALPRPGTDAAVVSLDTGDVVRSAELAQQTGSRPSAALPLMVLGVAAVAIVVGTLLVVKLAQSPPTLPEPLPEVVAPVAVLPPSPEPSPVEPRLVVATPDPPSQPEPVVVEPVPVAAPVKAPRVVRQPVTGPSGTLIVESTPKARVLMNKEFLGTTPLKVKVAVGSHRLRLDYGSTSHQLIINVVEGRETTVRDQAD